MAKDSKAAADAGAQAKFALFLASLFQRAGVATMGEFSALLGAFAESVSETDPDEGAILSRWADAIGATADR